MAINRETINEAVYNGTRTISTGVTPPGISGFKENICEYCTYDPEGAAAAYEEWQAAGNSIDEPLPVMFNAGSVHELVTDIIVENLAAVGIPAEPDPRVSETYFGELADGACGFCRVGWIADYPTYDNFLFDIFGTEALDGNNYGYSNDGVRRPRRRGQGDDRRGRPQRAVQPGRGAVAEHRHDGRADQLVPRRLRLQPGHAAELRPTVRCSSSRGSRSPSPSDGAVT